MVKEWPKMIQMAKMANFGSKMGTNKKFRVQNGKKKMNFSPVSNIFSNFYFTTQVIIATQSALNRHPDPSIKITNNSVFSGWIRVNMIWSTNKILKFELKQMNMETHICLTVGRADEFLSTLGWIKNLSTLLWGWRQLDILLGW